MRLTWVANLYDSRASRSRNRPCLKEFESIAESEEVPTVIFPIISNA